MLENTFILHIRPYRETSALLEIFSETHGRLTVIARGFKNRKDHRYLLTLFHPLAMRWTFNRELPTLTMVESRGLPFNFQDKKTLFCGFYLNELLYYLLAKEDPHPDIFTLYQNTLVHLQKGDKLEARLRFFERHFLIALGYGIAFRTDIHGHALNKDSFYHYQPLQGFIPLEAARQGNHACFSAETLLAIAEDDYSSLDILLQAKILFRRRLQILLGNKVLKSREMFQ